MKKQIPLAALMGVTGVVGMASVADAAPVAATLVSVSSYSANGTAAWNGTADTSTWTFDSVTGTAAMTGGSYSRLTKAGATPLMRHTMTGVTISSGAATGATWACIEGTFGGGGGNTGGVGASICGNYNFGANLTNQSTYTPSVTAASVALGGDDAAIGPVQTLVGSYSTMTQTALGGGLFRLDNRSNGTTTSTSGYDFVFSTGAVVPVPAAVWLFGSALGLMGVMRRRKSV